jgi:membrane-associated protease RseP (regulator of RpoE activity)
VKALPFGGYVRIVGMSNLEEIDPADEARSYRQASFPRRLAVAVAGSTVHFILALLTIWALFAFAQQSKPTAGVGELVTLSSATPAQVAGFRVGDRIVSYDGHKAGSWSTMHTYIEARAGVPISFVVSRDGVDQTIVATPADGSTLDDSSGAPIGADHQGFLGLEPTYANYSLLGSVPHSFRTFWDDGVVAAFKGIGAVFSPHGIANIGHQVASSPGSTPIASAGARPISLIGIVEVAGQLHGWAALASLFFEFNVFVGVLNLFPLLPFDGGHVAIAVYERIRSRPGRRYRADVNKMVPYAMAMMVVLAFVVISSVYLDVAHPISLH